MADLGEDDESGEEMDEEEMRREREREKIRLLKQRKIRTCGLKLPGQRIEGGSAAVFVRHDVEDESMDVDISIDHDESSNQNENHTTSSLLTQVNSNSDHKPSRNRRPTKKKLQSSSEEPLPNSRSRKKSRIGAPPNSKPPPPPPPLSPPKSRASSPPNDRATNTQDTTRKPKPETYKQAWSISEQHLLEQLLEQIPEGEKHRYVSGIFLDSFYLLSRRFGKLTMDDGCILLDGRKFRAR
jgi:hypothetical protein